MSIHSETTDSSDIVDQKLKLIMGLVWTLILHYSITMPTWEDEGGFGKDQTPKQRWVKPSGVPRGGGLQPLKPPLRGRGIDLIFIYCRWHLVTSRHTFMNFFFNFSTDQHSVF